MVGPLFLGGTALAQQIDPPSLELDVGPGDIDAAIAEAHEAIDTASNNAWEGQSPGGSASANPDLFNPDITNAIADAQEAIASGVSEALVTTAAGIVEEAKNNDEELAQVLEELQQTLSQACPGLCWPF